LEFDWEEAVGGIFVVIRLFGLSGTELVWVGALGFGGGTRGAGTIVILLGPVCILGTSPGTGMTPGWTRATPPLRGGGWFMTRLGPGRLATCTLVWDMVLSLVDVVESALLVTLWVECWERADVGRMECGGSNGKAGLGIGLADGWDDVTARADRDGATPTWD
jgi:hypothetical protein